VRDGETVHLFSRNELRLDEAYPELIAALARQPVQRFVLDGEVVALEDGVPSFARLQGRMQYRDATRARGTGIEVTYYVFDLLYLDGYDVTELPLRRRKALLRRSLSFGGSIRFSAHRNAAGEAFLDEACRRGYEGVIAKRADSKYVSRRSKQWLKLKCTQSQEMVIGGFTEPRGSRTGLGALLIGYYDDQGHLAYAGKVGTGFDTATLGFLRECLNALEQDTSPFERGNLPRRGVHWVRPELVGEVTFSEWTRDGRLRHPRFKGLRHDKDATTVVRERPATVP
jgi:bifunctional non-homologous end joining protein LigD